MTRSPGDEPDGAHHLTVVLTGDLTAADGDRDLLGDRLTPGVRHVVADVSGLDFVDASGLRMLLRARRVCADHKTTFTLHRPTPYLRWLLDLTGTAPLLIEPDERDERDERLTDRELLADERDRLLDERSDRLDARRDWEDIREDLADERELRLDRREQNRPD